jgi:2,3-bisphosphoglycerate-independent phosphoglycerate mutase
LSADHVADRIRLSMSRATSESLRSVVFVFLDGVGLGPADDRNPFWTAHTPALRRLLDGPLVDGVKVNGRVRDLPVLCRGIDATLGVPGLPQSGSGQTALFTGVNAAKVAGTHVFAFPTERLRRVIAEHSVLKRAVERGLRATLANAYSDGYWSWVQKKRRGRHSATTLTNMAANLPFRDFEDLKLGRAVYWDITHELARERFYPDLQPIAAADAGRRLAQLSTEFHLVLYESFITDLAGHRRIPLPYDWTLARVDGLLGGLIEARPPGATIVLCSDHGNLEDITFKGHTTNPVPLLVVGPGAADPVWDGVNAITDVSGAILSWLDGASPSV